MRNIIIFVCEINFLLSLTNNEIFSLRHILAAVYFNYTVYFKLKWRRTNLQHLLQQIYNTFVNGHANNELDAVVKHLKDIIPMATNPMLI